MKILIAEDHPSSALFLRWLLHRMGHEATIAPDGLKAWDLFLEERFPLIISDWVMPGLNGLELCRKIREHTDRPYTYVILLTCKQGQGERLEGLRAGADDFLVKPPDDEELAVRLEIARRILAVQEELEQRNAMLVELASSDELTGLRNRRKFREGLDLHFSMAARQGMPLSMVMVDVDHFKSYNDAFGHPAGDVALREVAATLRSQIRMRDEIARIGGEEIAVLFPDTSADLAIELAERLRIAVQDHSWPLRPLTVSLGVATTTPESESPSDLFERADLALYHSKHLGRNRVTHHRDLGPSSVETGQEDSRGLPLTDPGGNPTVPAESSSDFNL